MANTPPAGGGLPVRNIVIMRDAYRHIVLSALCLLSLIACQHNLHTTEARLAQADRQLEELEQCLQRTLLLDSIQPITTRTEGVYFYIFNEGQMVYWSDNRLNVDNVQHPMTDQWTGTDFRNAKGLCRWRRMGNWGILAAVPEEWNEVDDQTLSQSFSYRPLMEQREAEQNRWTQARLRVRIFYIASLLFFFGLVVFGIGLIIRKRGFKNMRLHTKFQYLFILLSFAAFIYIFSMSVKYVRRHYARQQQETLQNKCRYIRAALQSLYYWDYSLDSSKSDALNTDLRDIAFTYGVDIHVYNLEGQLVGSSTPQLFRQGWLSTYIAPDVFYADRHTCTRYEQLSNLRYLATYTEFVNGSELSIGYIAVPSFLSEDEMAMEVDGFLARLLPAYLIALFLAFIFSGYASSLLLKPIKHLSESMQQYELGRQNLRIEYGYHDEVGDLVNRYNEMVTALETASRRLARSEREGAWRTMARQVAHEINNSLTPMKLTLQQLQRTRGTERFEQYFDKSTHMLIEQIDNLSHIASSFSSFAKMPEVTVSEVDVADKLVRVLTLMNNNEQHIPIRYVGPNDGICVYADKDQIQQVFTNILRNALQALEDRTDGDVIVVLRQADDKVEISFSDNGGGIPEDMRSRIFTPNFTTKSYGTGLGLAIARNIVEGCDGSIRFETSEKGTTFFVTLNAIKA